MPDQPHSKTVRGTLSNPKTKAAIEDAKANPDSNAANTTSLGDPGSLKSEASDSEPVPDRKAQDGGTVGDGEKKEEGKAHGGSKL